MTDNPTMKPASPDVVETDIVTVRPLSERPTEDAIVTVMKGAAGAHVGILYRTDDAGTRRHLHLASP